MIEARRLTLDEFEELTGLFAPEDREAVSKMAAESVDENEVFDDLSLFGLIQSSSRQPASKSIADDESGNPLNDCLTDIFPFQVRKEIQKSVRQVADGIADLRQREARLDRMEQAVDYLRTVVSKMAGQTPPDTVRDEAYELEASPADDRSVFDSLFPARLPCVV